MNERLTSLLTTLYGDAQGRETVHRLSVLVEKRRASLPEPRLPHLDQADAILITYADQVQKVGRPPLRVLAEFCRRHLGGLVSGVHLLPFYPWSSDDGFSVVNYREVDPSYGTWEDARAVGEDFRLMFDAVINHISVGSAWFRGFLRDEAPYRDYFITVDGDPDLSQVVRPRALPLLTPFETSAGEKRVWTTFSADQVDLNYKEPGLLLEIIDLLLFYVAQGAEFIRLDAIAYLWKQTGTSCIHLPQTHAIIQLLRAVLDLVAPQVLLITETNVPHKENISYFGDGQNEAQLVYNFALPPLVLHALQTGSAQTLTGWAKGLRLPSQQVTFFNFLASHDGIGLNPARGILEENEIVALVEHVQAHGGLVSYKNNPDGSQSPYEMNINYFDALNNPQGDEPVSVQIDRFIAAHTILFALQGVPGIYFHSLFGSRSWPEGVAKSGRSRTINRQKLSREALEQELRDPDSLRHTVFTRLAHLLKMRKHQPAFHPAGKQDVLESNQGIFALRRESPGGNAAVICLHNVSDQEQHVDLNAIELPWRPPAGWRDLISGQTIPPDRTTSISLNPYQAVWLV